MTWPADPALPPLEWSIAVCPQCGDDEMRFTRARDRDTWAARHAADTGHAVVSTQRPRS